MSLKAWGGAGRRALADMSAKNVSCFLVGSPKRRWIIFLCFIKSLEDEIVYLKMNRKKILQNSKSYTIFRIDPHNTSISNY